MGTSDEVAAARLVARNAAARDTRRALHRWIRRPRLLLPWLALSAVLAVALLLATLAVADRVTPVPETGQLIAADPTARLSDFWFVLGHNLLVLALNLLVGVAVYVVRRSLPLQAARLRGVPASVHRRAATPALVLVVGLTVFSLARQAVTLGQTLADVSATSALSPGGILLRLLPHAGPELVAVFLPLAAVLWLEHQRRHQDLLAAVIASAAIALPIVVLAAWFEVAVASAFF